ncbi:Asp23/Gls24 family envelope stress response protein [Aeromicrobium sp. CF4.19]|uniref:Asp23/Gls24 family envelope stress response protein n=1 Tax=Aeromicrobium sp. CF4.19 TaxID=3373082 RepID=UPI003EE55EB9
MSDDFALSDLPGRGADRPAAERGTLEIKDRVLAKLARRASADVAGTVHRSAGLSGLGRHRYPDASVSVLGERAWIELDVAGAWPCDLHDLGERTRSSVAERVAALGGVHVERLDVTVHVITPESEKERRVQ